MSGILNDATAVEHVITRISAFILDYHQLVNRQWLYLTCLLPCFLFVHTTKKY